MINFSTYQKVPGMAKCRKRPIVIHAKQIEEPFTIETLEGNYKRGKTGDYLMRGIEGELYICDMDIFEKTYDWVK